MNNLTLTTSGALSRAHFALVQAIENADSAADPVIHQEIRKIEGKLRQRGSTSSQIREYLIILLQCSMSLVFKPPTPDYLEFSFPYAVQLAESGANLPERRIAYQFCIQCLPREHELNLMLVNTVRKDIESHEEARITLALDFILQSPNADVIPAIQHRLEALLGHKSSDVRRRALLSIRSMASLEPSIISSLRPRLIKRARSTDTEIATLAIDLLSSMPSVEILEILLQRITDQIRDGQGVTALLRVLDKSLVSQQTFGHSEKIMDILCDILMSQAPPRAPILDLTLECCRLLRHFPATLVLSSHAVSSTISGASPKRHLPLHTLRPLLESPTPNAQYTFLASLLHLDPGLWNGSTSTDQGCSLTQEEVGKIMSSLESKDSTLRLLTRRILRIVDPSILHAYADHLLTALADSSHGLSLRALERYVLRVFEIVDSLKCDGNEYAEWAVKILKKSHTPSVQSSEASTPPGKKKSQDTTRDRPQPVLESVVEAVLVHIHNADPAHVQSFLHVFIASLVGSNHTIDTADPDIITDIPYEYGPTGLILLSACVAEYGNLLDSTVSHQQLLSAFSRYLEVSSPAIQETLLLTMLILITRIPSDMVESSLKGVIERIKDLQASSGRHIKMRCQQFLDLSRDTLELKRIVARAGSTSLPSFLDALESRPSKPKLPPSSPPPFASPSYTSSTLPQMSASVRASTSKLRYDAYDAPSRTESLSPRRHDGRSRRASSTASAMTSPRSSSMRDDLLDVDDPLSQTVTAGELALRSAQGEIGQWVGRREISIRTTEREKRMPHSNLIGLESPFRTEPQLLENSGSSISLATLGDVTTEPADVSQEAFDSVWAIHGVSVRGWCASSPEEAVIRIGNRISIGTVRSEEKDPFIVDTPRPSSEICVTIGQGPNTKAAVRLKRGEEGDCLWVAHCSDTAVRDELRAILDE